MSTSQDTPTSAPSCLSPKNEKIDTCKSSVTSVKSQHKVEGKNKKSLHQKQQQKQKFSQQSDSQNSFKIDQKSFTTSRRTHQKNSSIGTNKLSPGADNKNNTFNSDGDKEGENFNCVTLKDFAERANEIKSEINKALVNQMGHKIIDQPIEVVKLKDDIYKLSNLQENSSIKSSITTTASSSSDNPNIDDEKKLDEEANTKSIAEDQKDLSVKSEIISNHQDHTATSSSQEIIQQGNEFSDEQKENMATTSELNLDTITIKPNQATNKKTNNNECKLDTDNIGRKEESSQTEFSNDEISSNSKKIENNSNNHYDKVKENSNSQSNINIKIADDGFEPLLNAKLDTNSKVVGLVSSLQKMFNSNGPNNLVELVCRKLVNISEQNSQLISTNEKYISENQKLLLIKQKLENLCRELQKSNNAIRIESLDLIKLEQGKAKDQTTKIQSTLSGVIKLFDENQQRNMSLRQENQDLQTKLKSLLDHCDNWEKSVEVTLRQKDIENRLIKTELAKANLLKNEEKEKFLGEKQELLQILSMMQEQQHRIEGQEAKLRSDLSSYASKYDECQAVISKGMNRFQTESKKMLKQIEKSKQDYKVLLSKYESSNKRMAQLLEEKQTWDKAMTVANKKITTLEKLCRALKEQKLDSKSEQSAKQQQKSSFSNNNKNTNVTKSKSYDKNKKLKDVELISQTKEITTSINGEGKEVIVEGKGEGEGEEGKVENVNEESDDNNVFVELDNEIVATKEIVVTTE